MNSAVDELINGLVTKEVPEGISEPGELRVELTSRRKIGLKKKMQHRLQNSDQSHEYT